MEDITHEGEILAGSLTTIGESRLVLDMQKAEISQQVSTAKQFPRSIKRASTNILELATLDDQAAEDCIYSLPRGGKPIVGPSIRLAEIVAGQWGNCRDAARVVDVNKAEGYVEAEGVFHDLETNRATLSRVRRSIKDRRGLVFKDDMILVTGNAAGQIARRNAILAGVPKAVWRKAYDAAEHVLKGDVQTLSERRGRAIASFARFGVKPEQIFAVLEVAGEEEVGLDHMPTLHGMFQAIKNKEATVEELFSPRQAGQSFAKVANPLADDEAPKLKPAEQPRAEVDDPIATAKERGAAAYAARMTKRALPPEYREDGRQAEGEAWIAGFDAAKGDAAVLAAQTSKPKGGSGAEV